jgi:hypothetical protein
VVHPTALKCAVRTGECARKSLELDNRLAAFDRDLVKLLSSSRDAIRHSRQILSEMRDRIGGLAP